MYLPRTRNYDSCDQHQRWALPDRVFFAAGACHILAPAFLERHGRPGMRALWIRPAPGYIGNHIFVSDGALAFDYHGYAGHDRLLAHYARRARRQVPGWTATLIDLPRETLISEALSRQYDGLWLRQPDQFLHDALPRARRFLDRFPPPGA